MSDAQPDLDVIQRWMQSVIMHPDGVAAGVASDSARQIVNVNPADVEKVLTRSKALTALERLQIYGSAYYARLLECMREEFPVLVYALGEETFNAFAFAYLQKYPSRSYTLNQLGAAFPRFLAETRPDGEKETWPDFIVDLATLEWTFSEVFDGPGVEGEPILDAARLQAIPPEKWTEARLIPVPCLRLLTLRYPVHQYYTAVRRQEEVTPPEPAETFLAVTRREYVVRHYPVERTAFGLLKQILSGQSIGDAIHAVTEAAEYDLDQLALRLQEWFRNWTAEGFFRSVEPLHSSPQRKQGN
jgi:hypothetical protein